jgi:hypothetical protein
MYADYGDIIPKKSYNIGLRNTSCQTFFHNLRQILRKYKDFAKSYAKISVNLTEKFYRIGQRE